MRSQERYTGTVSRIGNGVGSGASMQEEYFEGDKAHSVADMPKKMIKI
jgi:hypothetical protein